MVSRLTLGHMLPIQGASMPKPPSDISASGVQGRSVPNQNTAAVSKKNGGSFQTFNDALDSALSPAGFASSLDAGAQPSIASRDYTSAVATPEATLLSSLSAVVANKTEPPASATGAVLEQDSVQTKESTDDRASKVGSFDALKPALKQKASLNSSSTSTVLAPAVQADDASVQRVLAYAAPNGSTGPAAESESPEFTNTNAGARVSVAAGPIKPPISVENSGSQTDSMGCSTDAEAFRIALYAEPVSTATLENNTAATTKSGTEPVAPPSSQDPDNLQAKRVENTLTGQQPTNDKTALKSQPSEETGSSTVKGSGAIQGMPQEKKQTSAGGSDDDKANNRTGVNKTDLPAPTDPGAPVAASFRNTVRSTENSGQAAPNPRSAELIQTSGAAAASTAREMVVRLQSDSGESVSVRLLDQGGQVQVAVRSSDPLTAAQLRQDLTSLTSNLDRIGWRTDATVGSAAQTAASHESSSPEGEPQGGNRNSSLDWHDEPDRRKYSSSELWDEAFAGQNG